MLCVMRIEHIHFFIQGTSSNRLQCFCPIHGLDVLESRLVALVVVLLVSASAVLMRVVKSVVVCGENERAIPQYVDHPLRHRNVYQYDKLA